MEVDPGALAELYVGLPHVMFSVKDLDGRYTAVNQAFADRAGCRAPAEVLGRTAAELFPAELAHSYEEQDRQVIGSGRAVQGRLEMITRPDGGIGWYVTTKSPLRDGDGRVSAVVAISVDLRTGLEDGPAGPRPGLTGLNAALELVRARFAEPLRVEELAAVAGLSAAQLERRMRRALGITVKQYVLRVRIDEAARLLSGTEQPIAQIAGRCGFYDQAALTRRFTKVTGMSPGQYRTRSGGRRPDRTSTTNRTSTTTTTQEGR